MGIPAPPPPPVGRQNGLPIYVDTWQCTDVETMNTVAPPTILPKGCEVVASKDGTWYITSKKPLTQKDCDYFMDYTRKANQPWREEDLVQPITK